MKKNLLILSFLVLTITMANFSLIDCDSNKEQEIIKITQSDSGYIPLLGYIYFELGSYDMSYGISWSFSGASDSIDVWLFDEYNFDRFQDDLSATGYHLCSDDVWYISKSGKFQIPSNYNWYLVFCNNHFFRINYDDISCLAHEIHAKFGTVTYKPIDNDSDGFNDMLKVTCEVYFDTTYWTEGHVRIRAILYDENDNYVDDRSISLEYIENSDSFEILFIRHNGKGTYYAKLELFSFGRTTEDDISESSQYELFHKGHLTMLLIKSFSIGGGIFLVLIISLVCVIVRLKRKRKQQAEIEDLGPIQQNLCPNCKNIIAETGHKFCEHCGEAI